MGGRKPYYLKEVVGTSRDVGRKKAQLTKSLNTGDVTGVSKGSANLVIEHRDIAKILIYSKKLFSSVIERYKQEDLKKLKDIKKKVRFEWSHLKNKEKLKSNPIINSAVVDNVSSVLNEKAKNATS